MPWELKNDRPIYAQLIEQIQLRIVSGVYPAGVNCHLYVTWPQMHL